MKISFNDIRIKMTGFSIPVFGASWQYEKGEREIIKDLFIFLEDRRVLYNPTEIENIVAAAKSINIIREKLTSIIAEFPEKGTETTLRSLKDMRRASRKFLDEIAHVDLTGDHLFFHNLSHSDQFKIGPALGDLRTLFGIHLASLAIGYSIDVDDDLVSIMPLSPSSDRG